MVDWGAGSYETTSGEELEPVSEAVVELAGITSGEHVVDLATGSGNAALVAARRGAHVVGVDGAPRLLEVAAARARAADVTLEVREGDLLALPVEDASADVALSVFGIIFVADPAAGLREVARVLRPGGRALVSAWIPEGPIDAMLAAGGRLVARITGGGPRGSRFAWHDPATLGPLAAEAGLTLESSERRELAIHAASAEAYIELMEAHPMAVAVAPVIRGAGAEEELRATRLEVLRDANEDPDRFLVHTPYVVHRLVAADH